MHYVYPTLELLIAAEKQQKQPIYWWRQAILLLSCHTTTAAYHTNNVSDHWRPDHLMSSEISLLHKVHRLSYFFIIIQESKGGNAHQVPSERRLYMQSILTAWLYSFKSPHSSNNTSFICMKSQCTYFYFFYWKQINRTTSKTPPSAGEVHPGWTFPESWTMVNFERRCDPKRHNRRRHQKPNTEFRKLCSAETESRARCRRVMVYIADACWFHWTVLKCLWFCHKASSPTFNCPCGISPSTLWREQTHEEIKTNFKTCYDQG